LKVLCPQGPRPIKELRNACLLVAYPKRTQLLPLIASAVYRQFSPEQRQEQESLLIQAYSAWMQEGTFQEGDSEQGAVITELAVLLLRHHRLLEAAEHVIRYGWISFKLGNAPRLALLIEHVKKQFDWQASLDNMCGGKVLHHMLTPFLGKELNREQRVKDYRFILDAAFNGKVILRPSSLLMLTHYIMLHALNELRFTEAQEMLEVCCRHLEPLRAEDVSLHVALLLKQGMVLNCQCEHAEEHKNWQEAERKHEQAMALYRQVAEQLATCSTASSSTVSSHPYSSMLKRQQAYALNYLGYHLYRTKHYEESLMALEQALFLQEQGYADLDGLACCYGDISQTLAALGRFQEALHFDEKAYAEAQHQAETGHMLSQEEIWIYRVNRGCLYLRLGRIDEAEYLLQEALPHISAHRRMYRMFAKEALDEIEQWRQQATSPEHQLDWRWVERFRALASYDTYWWLAAAGPLTEREQQEWQQRFRPDIDETTKSRLATLLMQSRQREIETALQEQREPCFHYPALDIQAVRAQIVGLAQLEHEISQDEPHALVRRFYHDAIEEELDTLRMIEATYQRNSDRFWEYMQRVIPAPTPEEMHYALGSIRRDLRRGLSQAETQGAAESLLHILHEQCGLSLDLSSTHMEEQELYNPAHIHLSQEQHMVTVQAAKRFFEAVFQQSGFDGWRVIIDPHASNARVEQGMRCLFLEDHALSVQDIKHLLAHELAGHVARCIAGERSLLGLLGIHTRNSLVTEEGLASYDETLEAMPAWKGQPEMIFRPGTLATGFASGVITPPQTFRSLFTLLEALFFLRRLLGRIDADEETAREKARQLAITRCLRTFRGVPDLTHAGICFTQDATYLRGLLMIEQAVKRDENVLARLAVGVVALEQLADLQELGIVSTPQPLRKLLQDPRLHDSILSFEQPASAEAAQ
ncbi:MAG: DUF1704 domain-containing protein, partial [Chloroflexi bacterium]|nr:DUF1704 domain-containing protein [Chloroflexota bacterium]